MVKLEFITLLFSTRENNFDRDILPHIQTIKRNHENSILVHSFSPEYNTQIKGKLDNLFPQQFCFYDGKNMIPLKKQMMYAIAGIDGKVFVLGNYKQDSKIQKDIDSLIEWGIDLNTTFSNQIL